jgi:hypothetical protein
MILSSFVLGFEKPGPLNTYVIDLLYLVGLNSSDDISSKNCALTSFMMRQEGRFCQTRSTTERADFKLHPLIYTYLGVEVTQYFVNVRGARYGRGT